MECATPVQLFNFLISTTGTVIVDCRLEEKYLRHRLKYPLLIPLSVDKLPDLGYSKKLCEHHSFSSSDVQQLDDEELKTKISEIELLVGPYDRCVLRQRNKATIVLITDEAAVPHRVASLASILLQEGKCLHVYHTNFSFEKFADLYPFMTEHKSRRQSNLSAKMPTSISLELDDYQIMKQKKDLITQYPNSIIAGHIYLGTRQQALDLEMMKSMGITHIIRAHDVREHDYTAGNHDVYRRLDSIKYLDVAVDDKLGTDIGMFLKPCVAFYNEATREYENCQLFIHCNMGISRSSTIVIAILMTYKDMNLKEALEFAQSCRHQVQPNYSFMKELIKYEHNLLGCNSLKMTELTKMNAHYSRAYAVDKQDHKSCTIM